MLILYCEYKLWYEIIKQTLLLTLSVYHSSRNRCFKAAILNLWSPAVILKLPGIEPVQKRVSQGQRQTSH